jgi:hypothetical protein
MTIPELIEALIQAHPNVKATRAWARALVEAARLEEREACALLAEDWKVSPSRVPAAIRERDTSLWQYAMKKGQSPEQREGICRYCGKQIAEPCTCCAGCADERGP